MSVNTTQQKLLKSLPGVDQMLLAAEGDAAVADAPHRLVLKSIRDLLAEYREAILERPDGITMADLSSEGLIEALRRRIDRAMSPNLKRVVNATGVVVHTNLGRSLLAPEALANVQAVAERYSNLEYDLAAGRRGSRYTAVDDLICEMTGAEAAMVVNNNASAVLLCLDTVARGMDVVISRGELVEIGGSFRVPDVMAKSGCRLKEIGTTNRTHPRDFENAIDASTGLLLKVHTSNYSIVGFTREVSLEELVDIGGRHDVPVMEDLGSGTLVDFSRYGLHPEPTVQASVNSGADLITFSGDKLLGGPQGGLIVGKREWIERIRDNPLTRALRIDKLTLAALEATLRMYRDDTRAVDRIPTLRMITLDEASIGQQAERLRERLQRTDGEKLTAELIPATSRAGGGSLPMLELPTVCVAVSIAGMHAGRIERHMRSYDPPIIGRVENDRFIVDLRTVQDDEIETIAGALDVLTDT
jgi:L-seryl-tRNA(Ser) seleniumtransferase